jgi:DNA-binding MarR family transcriptional regulator
MSDEWLFWDDARRMLGISRDKMTKIVKSGLLESKEDPLDGRRVLVKRSSVEALKAQSVSRPRKED